MNELLESVEKVVTDSKVIADFVLLKQKLPHISIDDMMMALEELAYTNRIVCLKIEFPGSIRPIPQTLYFVKGTKIAL